MRVSPFPLEPTVNHSQRDTVVHAVETRTYWSCYLMDCMVNSGTYNPPMLPMSEMIKLKIPRPLGTVEFAFGAESAPASVTDSPGGLDITQSFEILVSGFEIWWQVQTFIFNDGRRAPGMCAPQNCPWVPTSPWYNTKTRLEEWRAGQHRQLHYPETSVAVHMTLGYGETFTYLNLLYYLRYVALALSTFMVFFSFSLTHVFSVLMLHREYTPFLPTPQSVPQGPVDHPILEAPAPEGFWDESAGILASGAENIANILNEAAQCGVPLLTPFAGFCAFSAGYVLSYCEWFPKMNLNRSPRAREHAKMCMDYLEEFRNVWTIADGWVGLYIYIYISLSHFLKE